MVGPRKNITGFAKLDFLKSPLTLWEVSKTQWPKNLCWKIKENMWNLFSHFLCHPSKMGRHLISCINLSFLQDMDIPKWDLTPKGKHYSSWFPKLKLGFLEPFRTFLWNNVDSSLETKVLLEKRRLWKVIQDFVKKSLKLLYDFEPFQNQTRPILPENGLFV